MPTATYEPIQTQTLSSATQTVTLSSIPGTYTDLVLVISPASATASGSAIRMRINGDTTASNYSMTWLQGLGSGTSMGQREQNDAALGYQVGVTNSFVNAYILNFMNYANTSAFKTYVGRGNSGIDGTHVAAMLYRSTSAITSMSFTVGPFNTPNNNFAVGSTFTLYGIKAA